MSHRQGTGAVVQAVHDLVAAVLLPDGKWGAATPSVTPAFDRVEVFDAENLVEAFRYLLVTEQKVCVVVPMDERFEPVFQVRKMTVKRELPVMVLISDRVLGKRKDALLGNADTPGALALMELQFNTNQVPMGWSGPGGLQHFLQTNGFKVGVYFTVGWRSWESPADLEE